MRRNTVVIVCLPPLPPLLRIPLPTCSLANLKAIFERTLDENVALTGVLSSLCLAATAAEVSPVRRLLLILLFDGTRDAPFRRYFIGDPEFVFCDGRGLWFRGIVDPQTTVGFLFSCVTIVVSIRL